MLRLLAKRHLDLGRWRNKVCCRLHALRERAGGGRYQQGNRCRHKPRAAEGLHAQGVAAVERHRLALELLDDLVRIDDPAAQSRQRINDAVAASGTTLTELFGVGP